MDYERNKVKTLGRIADALERIAKYLEPVNFPGIEPLTPEQLEKLSSGNIVFLSKEDENNGRNTDT